MNTEEHMKRLSNIRTLYLSLCFFLASAGSGTVQAQGMDTPHCLVVDQDGMVFTALSTSDSANPVITIFAHDETGALAGHIHIPAALGSAPERLFLRAGQLLLSATIREPDGRHHAMVKSMDKASILRVETMRPPLDFRILESYPNPTRSGYELRIMLQIDRSQHIHLGLFTLLGTRVADVVDQWFAPGEYVFHYVVTDIAAGTYFLVMSNEHAHTAEKVLILR